MKKIDRIIKKLNDKIKDFYSDFNGVYLYGSYANNTAQKDSDINLVALFDNSLSREERMNLWGIIGRLEAELDLIFDIHPMTLNELKNNPVYYNQVVNRGIYYGAR